MYWFFFSRTQVFQLKLTKYGPLETVHYNPHALISILKEHSTFFAQKDPFTCQEEY